jgi:CHAT domain-containing protein/tetratricopeptide (TPR) repeat protein
MIHVSRQKNELSLEYKTSYRAAKLFAGFMVCFLLLNIRAQSNSQEVLSLTAGQSVEREITGSEAHTYSLALAAGEFVHVTVMQRGINVVVDLLSPDGQLRLRADSPTDTRGPETVHFVADLNGAYSLKVAAKNANAARGKYDVLLAAQRPATERDREYAAAAATFYEAKQLYLRHTNDATNKALALYEKLLPVWRSLGDKMREGDTLRFIGILNARLNQSSVSVANYKDALNLFREIGDRAREEDILYYLGNIHASHGEHETAIEYYRQYLQLDSAGADKAETFDIWTALAISYSRLGEYRKAAECYEQIVSLDPQRIKSDPKFLNNLGWIYLYTGDLQNAQDHFDKALAASRGKRDSTQQGQAFSNLGDLYLKTGDLQKALDSYNSSLELSRKNNKPGSEIDAMIGIGRAQMLNGDLPGARASFENALGLSKSGGYRNREAVSQRLLGQANWKLGFHQKAIESLEASRDSFHQFGMRPQEADVLYELAKLKREIGQPGEARPIIETALELTEALRSAIAAEEFQVGFFEEKRHFYELYADILMQLHESSAGTGYDLLAWQAAEKAQARRLLEILVESSAKISDTAEPTLIARERSLQQQINMRERQRSAALSNKLADKAAKLEEETRHLLTEYRNVRAQIRLRSPKYAALTQPEPLSVAETQRLLDDDTILLEYLLGENRSFLWAVTPASIKGYALPGRDKIETHVRRMYELLTTRDQTSHAATAEYNKLASTLGRILLGPVANQLGKKRLVIVSDGALQYVPFAALSLSKAEEASNPLIVDHEIVNLPSTSVLAVLRREMTGRISAPKALAVFADPVFSKDDPRVAQSLARNSSTPEPLLVSAINNKRSDSSIEKISRDAGLTDFVRLRFSRQEADAITALLPEKERLKALDFSASRATAQSAELIQYRTLHFATHGLLNSKHPELSGLVFSLIDERGQPQDGFLRFHEIYNLKLNADLVVLSACQTALGKEVRGEGLIGLTRGFMYAGAPRVVASLWRVDDRATAELMKRFYEGMMKRGLRPAAAMRAAQVSMMKEARWRAPQDWAAFTIQGEWR